MARTGFVSMGLCSLEGGSLTQMFEHNMRIEQSANVNEELSDLNHDYMDDREGRTFEECVFDRISELQADGAIKHTLNDNAIGAIEYVIRANGVYLDEEGNAPSDFDMENWAKDTVEWARELCNPEDHKIRYTNRDGVLVEKENENIISAVLHRDESTPHIHIVMIPINEHGCLNSNGYRHPSVVKNLQKSYHEKVGEKYGLEAGSRGSKAKAKDIRKYHDKINQVFEVKHPAHIPGESIEEYDKRVDDALQTAQAHINDMERERDLKVNAARGEKDTYIKGDYKLHAEVNEILGLGRTATFDLEEMREIAERAERMKKLEYALANHPDKNFREELSSMVEKADAWSEKGIEKETDERGIERER